MHEIFDKATKTEITLCVHYNQIAIECVKKEKSVILSPKSTSWSALEGDKKLCSHFIHV